MKTDVGSKKSTGQSTIAALGLAEGLPRLGHGRSGDRHRNIYKVIRERISLLNYAPGTVLSEAELAGEFAVSRTPIRRVLQRLHYEGMVEIRNGVGTIVSDIDLKTMKEIYDLRMHIAELMGVLSPRHVTEAHVTSMEELYVRATELRKGRDFEGYARLCNDLEEVLMSMIGSAPLREMTDLLYYRVSRIWVTFLPNLSWERVVSNQVTEISEMIDAMKRDDMRRVGEVRRIYMQSILSQVSDYLSGGIRPNAVADV